MTCHLGMSHVRLGLMLCLMPEALSLPSSGTKRGEASAVSGGRGRTTAQWRSPGLSLLLYRAPGTVRLPWALCHGLPVPKEGQHDPKLSSLVTLLPTELQLHPRATASTATLSCPSLELSAFSSSSGKAGNIFGIKGGTDSRCWKMEFCAEPHKRAWLGFPRQPPQDPQQQSAAGSTAGFWG